MKLLVACVSFEGKVLFNFLKDADNALNFKLKSTSIKFEVKVI